MKKQIVRASGNELAFLLFFLISASSSIDDDVCFDSVLSLCELVFVLLIDLVDVFS